MGSNRTMDAIRDAHWNFRLARITLRLSDSRAYRAVCLAEMAAQRAWLVTLKDRQRREEYWPWRDRESVHYASIDRAYGQAMTYVWGRQDESGKDAKDTGESQVFAALYALHKRAYLREELHFMHNIQSAYDRWLKFGEIAD